MSESDALWYQDAIIYQTHVKAFFDSNDDGIGDFRGLIQKLDYVQDLGVSALWLLPFYPSPLRDDGYDIADYEDIHASYGDMRDFRRFMREAHARGIKVITELVVNHTSDQHPWFQRARAARPGSARRNYYVWSDTLHKYRDARIIFLDAEQSNWAWDPVAKAYYWHRFYSHQPDLNFDNPRVLDALLRVMKTWLEIGVDGLRLDAVPYLCEREGTSCENLPETHGILRRIRSYLDEHFENRMLLAEANQWPEDVMDYFGDANECHVAFHFPLMPRIYMAVAQEDRLPIIDILRQTPEIPSTCQWAIFLRNHDELTLEMVTNRERDYMWNHYAADRRMRLNLGIRRRLAPLMENDRDKIELLNSLLMSLPGTPVVYYGDELGMGDNVFLGDRDGVRTPMQWSPDRNGGFSRADPGRLYLPPIMDPVYGYEAVNVEAQTRSPSSMLNWMKRLIEVRQARKVFGRGTMTILYPSNRKILAYLREYGGDTVLCVANLSRSSQPVQLDLSAFKGRIPVELMGRTPFPRIGELPYMLTVAGHGFYWFQLALDVDVPSFQAAAAIPHEPIAELPTLVLPHGLDSLLTSHQARGLLERDILPVYLAPRRWFAAKSYKIMATRVTSMAWLARGAAKWLLAVVHVSLEGAEEQHYWVPMGLQWEESIDDTALLALAPQTIARTRKGPSLGALYDAPASEGFALEILDAVRENRTVELENGAGTMVFSSTSALPRIELTQPTTTRIMSLEQSNTSILIGQQVLVKCYRRMHEGIQPELEIGLFLTEVAQFPNTPKLLGYAEHRRGEVRTALCVLQEFLPNHGDGWSYMLEHLGRFLERIRLLPPEEVVAEDPHMYVIHLAQLLGQRTAELHRAFALQTGDPAFDPEPATQGDQAAWHERAAEQIELALEALAARPQDVPEDLRDEVQQLLTRRTELLARAKSLVTDDMGIARTRCHGDYHLGQILVEKDDVMIIDFEGEPARAVAERRLKQAPMRDVAGMIRSFDYAAWAAVLQASSDRPEDMNRLLPYSMEWKRRSIDAFLMGYHRGIEGCPSFPADPVRAQSLLELFMLEKVFYEIRYEMNHRPAWLRIPLRGILGLFAETPR